MPDILENLPSPKRDRSTAIGRASWYPYYAGFSEKFAHEIMSRFCPNKNSRIMDPWNGSGTTTSVGSARGLECIGFDLNPVMSIVARARLLNRRDRSSLIPLAKMVIRTLNNRYSTTENDGLSDWFKPVSVSAIRSIEATLQFCLLGLVDRKPMFEIIKKADYSDLVCFYYVALFRTVRGLLGKFQGSNPTWMKKPSTPQERISTTRSAIYRSFLLHVKQMENALCDDAFEKIGRTQIDIASSNEIPLGSDVVDMVITSPPYCTRIDYANATRVELAILGISSGMPFEALRRELIGTPTVPRIAPQWETGWGPTCKVFLQAVWDHPSKSSSGYYFKGLSQYFHQLQQSINEIQRCLRSGGVNCLVVQDSFYKDVRIDLAKICEEMSNHRGMSLIMRENFHQKRNLAQVNSRSRKYRISTPATESVLVFRKN